MILTMADIDYSLATRRLYWFTLGSGVLGTPVAAWKGGMPSGLGFAMGAAGAVVNLWLWQRVAGRLGPDSSATSPPAAPSVTDESTGPEYRSSKVNRGPSAASLTFRVLALFALAYAIVRALNVNGLAVLCGLLASTLAAIAEILYELVLLRLTGNR